MLLLECLDLSNSGLQLRLKFGQLGIEVVDLNLVLVFNLYVGLFNLADPMQVDALKHFFKYLLVEMDFSGR